MNVLPLTSKQALQAFLELLNIYHSFLPQKVASVEPLLDKKAPWIWGCHQNATFHSLKTLLISNSVLTHYVKSLPRVLATDASPYSISHK